MPRRTFYRASPTEPHPRSTARLRPVATLGSAVAFLVALLLSGASFAAVPSVYHSPADDGVDPGAPVTIPGSGQSTLFLYVDGGNSASSFDACHQGAGDEVCWWDLHLEGQTGLSLDSFTASGDVLSNLSGSVLRINGGDTNGTLGPTKIGELTVSPSPGGTLELTAGNSVSSALNLHVIPPTTVVTVPEPGQVTLLAAGIGLLWHLNRRRSRRKARRAGALGARLRRLSVVALAGPLVVSAAGTAEALCGDTNDSSVVESGDPQATRQVFVGLSPALPAPDNCNVIGAANSADADGNGLPDDCDLVDLVVLLRTLSAQEPGISHTCEGEPPLAPAAVPTGGVGAQEPIQDDRESDAVHADEVGVVLNTGESQLIRADLIIPGRSQVDFDFTRRYRSRLVYDGPLGHGWDFSYNEALHEQPGGDLLRQNGQGHLDLWVKQLDDSYEAPPGYFATLSKEPDGQFLYREPNGFKRLYDVNGRLRSHEDRFGNRMRFEYDAQGNLSQAIDPFGRVVDFVFQNEAGVDRLVQMTDFAGRVVTFDYDVQGDLVEVTTPAVTGTSTGNDFPSGRSEQYGYSSGFAEPELNHNLLTVTRPEEVASAGPDAVVASYYTNPLDTLTFDRISTRTVGGTNASGIPAGGTASYSYQALNQAVPPGDPSVTRLQVTLTKRNGNVVDYFGNELLHEIWRQELTQGLRAGEPAHFETRFEYDADGQMTRRLHPEGNETQYSYDSGGDRAAQSNLLETRDIADAGRGGGEDLVTTMTYEPVFNQLKTRTDPRGNAAAFTPPLGAASAARYTTTWSYDYQEGNGPIPDVAKYLIDISGITRSLGDLNGDGSTNGILGLYVRLEEPSVLLEAASNEAARIGGTSQAILSELQWNDRGQLTAEIDPEGNLTTHAYHPENDPDGDGSAVPGQSSSLPRGYLETTTVDATPAPSRRSSASPPALLATTRGYDAVGNLTSERDPRGVVTSYEVNALDEVVVETRGADVSEAVSTGELITGEAAFAYRTRSTYDFNGRVVLVETENRAVVSTTAGVGDWVDENFVYDILDNPLEHSIEIDVSTQAVTEYRYDGNDLLTDEIDPETDVTHTEYDERDLLFKVHKGFGTADVAIFQTDYDLNENILREIDAEDNDSSGSPEETIYSYDGFDRRTVITDPLGNQTVSTYDINSNVVRVENFGHRPGDPFGGNTLLSDAIFHNDELDRRYRIDEVLFLADGFFPLRPEELRDFDSDGEVTSRKEYDALSRLTFLVEDDLDTREIVYDGASRDVETIDALGSRVLRSFDQNSNLVEKQSIEVSPGGLVPDETFTHRYVYDQLDRLVRKTDNVGRTQRLGYDSRDNQTTSSDGVGPTVADPLGLFPGSINDPGNSRTNHYDGRDLLVREVTDLRVGGIGSGAIDLSNASNPDGQITVEYQYDLDSRLTGMVDDNGSTTGYAYDALDRLVLQTNADTTQFVFTYDRDSNRLTTLDPNGSAATNTYDALDRLSRRDIVRGAGVLGTTVETYEYDGLSRATHSFDNNGTFSNHTSEQFYDSLHRLIEEQQDGEPHSSIWSGDGNRELLVYPTTVLLGYEYDALNRMVNVGNPLPPSPLTGGSGAGERGKKKLAKAESPDPQSGVSTAGAPVSATTAAIDWIGPGCPCRVGCDCDCRPLLISMGNGTELSFLDNAGTSDIGYNGVPEAVSLRHLLGAVELIDRDYGYNRAYMRNSEQLNDFGGSPTNLFGLDSGYRVVSTDLPADSAPESFSTLLDYTLDGVGNRVAVDVSQDFGGGTVINFTDNYVGNLMNEYDSAGGGGARSHDPNGNLISASGFDYSYDYKNRLVEVRRQVDQVVLSRYEYDSHNRRMEKLVFDLGNPGTVVEERRYLHDDWNVIEEWADEIDHDDNGAIATYLYGGGVDRPLQMDTSISFPAGAGSFFYHQDARRNVVAMTDGVGAIVEKTRYDDFGNFEQSVAIGNPYLFQGRRYDPETGLFYYRNRYYDPVTGRFLQRDPIFDQRNAANQYTFVANNPPSLFDAYGLGEAEGDCPPFDGTHCKCLRSKWWPYSSRQRKDNPIPHDPSDPGAKQWPKSKSNKKTPKPKAEPEPEPDCPPLSVAAQKRLKKFWKKYDAQRAKAKKAKGKEREREEKRLRDIAREFLEYEETQNKRGKDMQDKAEASIPSFDDLLGEGTLPKGHRAAPKKGSPDKPKKGKKSKKKRSKKKKKKKSTRRR